MTEDWEKNVAEAHDAIARISSEETAAQKSQIMATLNMADQTLDKLEATQNAEEFNQLAFQLVLPIMAQVMSAGQPQPGLPTTTTTSDDTVVVTIKQELDDAGQESVLGTLEKLTDTPDESAYSAQAFDGETLIEISPVKDIDAFAKKIKFGKVLKVDPKTRTITVEMPKSDKPADDAKKKE